MSDRLDRLQHSADWLNENTALTRAQQAKALGISLSGLSQLILRAKAAGLTVADSRGHGNRATVPESVP